MLCNHMRHMMALKGDKSSMIENCTLRTSGLAWMGSTTSLRKVVNASLNPNIICLGFSKADGENPIYLNANICNRLVELPGSTKIRLTSKSLIPNVRMRAS